MFTHEVTVGVASLHGELPGTTERQHAVDRRFNRARYDADLAGVVQVALEPTHVSVWLGQ